MFKSTLQLLQQHLKEYDIFVVMTRCGFSFTQARSCSGRTLLINDNCEVPDLRASQLFFFFFVRWKKWVCGEVVRRRNIFFALFVFCQALLEHFLFCFRNLGRKPKAFSFRRRRSNHSKSRDYGSQRIFRHRDHSILVPPLESVHAYVGNVSPNSRFRRH